MSNLPIKFLSVEINNFRGVPGKLIVPLDAPLTVIYAANGTGKSTICNALEWLLTGRVEDVKGSGYSCHWGQGDTSVYAQCLIDGQPHELWRKGTSIWLAREGKKRSKISEEHLLSLLTPETITGKSTSAANKFKRSWLRNSRWLYSNSLSLLIDNNKAEERQQIFADILGFGHLTSTLRDLRDYRKALPNTRGLVDNIIRLSDEIEEAQRKLQESAPGRAKAQKNLEVIFERLQPKPTGTVLSVHLREAKLRVGLFEQQTIRRTQGLNEISKQWEQYHSSLQQLTSLQDSISSISAEQLELSKQQQERTGQLGAANIKFGDGKRSVDWAADKINIFNKWALVVNLPSLAEYFSQGQVTQEILSGKFVEFTWSREKQEAWRDGIDHLLANFEAVLKLVSDQRRLEEKYVYPPVNLDGAVAENKLAQEEIIRLQANFDALAGTAERMTSLGIEILSVNETSHCPLCTHEWPSPKALRDVISAKAFMSPVIKQAANKLDAARGRAKQAVDSLASAKAEQFAHDEFIKQLNSVKEKLKAIEARTHFLEIMQRPDYSTIDRSNLEYLKERVSGAIDLGVIFEQLSELESFFSLIPNVDIASRIGQLIASLENYKAYYQKQMDESAPERIRLEQELSGIVAVIKEKASQVNRFTANRSVVSANIDRFNKLWAEFIGAVEVSNSHKSSAIVASEKDCRELDKLKALLAECELVASLDVDAGLIAKLDVEKKRYEEKLAVAKKCLADADRTIDQYSDHVKALTSSSLGLLLGPAAELFSRMHANEVYKGLGVSEGTEYLHWTAFAEGDDTGLDAESKFSQGQRQDLALSLYLARARNTGGSFFLDEPIAHLDDLNRVAMLDIFRLVATSMPSMSIVLTTASEGLARHMAQKFSSITDRHVLNMVHLEGNPRTGVQMRVDSNVERQLNA